MSTLALTLGIAFVAVMIAFALIGISRLLTGKSNIRLGSCGRDPTKKRDRDKSCGTSSSCSLCEKPKTEKNTKEDDDELS